MALNHSSPVLGILVSCEMLSGEIGKWRIPKFVEVPLKFSAKSCETHLWWPCNLWQKCMHPALMKASTELGSSMINFRLIGSYLNGKPPLFILFGVAISFVLQRWPSLDTHTCSLKTWWQQAIYGNRWLVWHWTSRGRIITLSCLCSNLQEWNRKREEWGVN